MAIVTVGIDLTKNVFAVHGVDEFCKPTLLRPEVPRAKLLELVANLQPRLIGTEACSGALGEERKTLGFSPPKKLGTLLNQRFNVTTQPDFHGRIRFSRSLAEAAHR